MPHRLIPRDEKAAIIEIPGVVSVGEGERDGVPVIVIGVDPDVPVDRGRLPDTVAGHPVVVRDRPPFTSQQTTFQERHRPVPSGVSTSTPTAGTGTLGFFMTDGSFDYLTSNNHVFADEGAFSAGEPLIQPGNVDAGSRIDDRVGALAGFTPLEDGATIDFAWGALSGSVDATYEIHGIGEVEAEPVSPSVDDEVLKSGRTTGLTSGTVTETGATVSVSYDNGTLRIDDCIILTKMSDNGDSGSPIVLDNGEPYTPVGMIFAGSDQHSVGMEMMNVLSNTSLSIIGSEERFDTGLVSIGSCGVKETDAVPGSGIWFEANVRNDETVEGAAEVQWSAGGVTVATQSVTIPAGGVSSVASPMVSYETLRSLVGVGDYEVTARLSNIRAA